MTNQEAKAEAEKIIQKHYPYTSGNDMASAEEFKRQKREGAIECALIHVEGIMMEIPMYTGGLNPKYEFWSKVKEELELI